MFCNSCYKKRYECVCSYCFVCENEKFECTCRNRCNTCDDRFVDIKPCHKHNITVCNECLIMCYYCKKRSQYCCVSECISCRQSLCEECSILCDDGGYYCRNCFSSY